MIKNKKNFLNLKLLAVRQWKDYQKKTPGTFFEKENNNLSIEDAYIVQSELAKLRCLDGDCIAGYKVGCTGSGIVEQFGVAGPVYGHIFHNEIYVSGKKLIYNNFVNLAIEGEMAVVIGEDMKITNAFPVIELHNFIFRAKSKTLTELITNNAINAGVVISNKNVMKPFNQWSSAKILAVKINEKIIDSGNLWAMPGGAKEAVDWLQKKLIHHGFSLKPGNLVLTGTPLNLHSVKPGDQIGIFIDNVELVSCKVI